MIMIIAWEKDNLLNSGTLVLAGHWVKLKKQNKNKQTKREISSSKLLEN